MFISTQPSGIWGEIVAKLREGSAPREHGNSQQENIQNESTDESTLTQVAVETFDKLDEIRLLVSSSQSDKVRIYCSASTRIHLHLSSSWSSITDGAALL